MRAINCRTQWGWTYFEVEFEIIAQTYLQPHYSNGVFGNVYFSLDNTKRWTLPAPHCRNWSCRYLWAMFPKKIYRWLKQQFRNLLGKKCFVKMFTDSCFVSSTVVSNRFQETAQIVITKFSKTRFRRHSVFKLCISLLKP